MNRLVESLQNHHHRQISASFICFSDGGEFLISPLIIMLNFSLVKGKFICNFQFQISVVKLSFRRSNETINFR